LKTGNQPEVEKNMRREVDRKKKAGGLWDRE